MKKKVTFLKTRFAHILLIMIFASGAMASILINGLPFGNDLPQHYQFAASLYESVSNGDLYPGLSGSPNHGLGDYGIRFYPPLSYYALAFGFFLTGNWFAASAAVFFAVFLIGGAGVYFWVREECSDKQAIIAAALFIFAPYHLNQIYNNFLYAEFVAGAIIPFCFLFVHRIVKRANLLNICGLAISFALLILTHLPSLIICSGAFAMYGIILALRSADRLKNFAALGFAVLLAVASTSFYWLKLITELDWINAATAKYFSNIYDYRNNFLLRPANFINFTDDVLAIWLADVMLISVILVSLPTIVYIFKKKLPSDKLLWTALSVMAFSIVMASVVSKPLWDGLGFLQKVQFPWRWLGIVSVTGAVVASYGIARASEQMKNGGSVFLSAGLGFCLLAYVFSSIFITKQAAFIPAADFTNSKVEKIAAAPSFECWWTVWAKPNFYQTRGSKVTSAHRAVTVRRWTDLEKVIGIGDGRTETLELAILYYPHWKATVDGKETGTRPTSSGLLEITVPSGRKNIRVYFEEPGLIVTAGYISAAAWLMVIVFAVIGLFTRRFAALKSAD